MVIISSQSCCPVWWNDIVFSLPMDTAFFKILTVAAAQMTTETSGEIDVVLQWQTTANNISFWFLFCQMLEDDSVYPPLR